MFIKICKNKISDYNYIVFYNTNQRTMKTLFWWTFAIIMATIIFCVGIILIPMQTKIAETIELTYIFVDENNIKYDIFEPVHGAATDWSFLFEENNNTGVVLNENITKSGNITNIDYLSNMNEVITTGELKLEDKIKEMENNQTGVNLDVLIKEVDTIKKEIENKTYSGCLAPWKTIIEHGESVIAYEQRKDAPSICNAQRRICNDGILNGSYTQWACKEDVEYRYTRVKVTSENNKVPWELIQNPWYAKNDGAEFNTDGKINPNIQKPKSERDNSIKDGKIKDKNIKLWKNNYYNCVTPWGEIVQHGQFVKAYQSQLWFVDEKCQVELRLCLNWKLNGRYDNKKCEYTGVTTQDYRWWNVDVTQASEELLDDIAQENPDKKWFFGWVKGLFR